MKISKEQIEKIRDRISNLNQVLDKIDTEHPSNVTCAMGASLNSLNHILEQIDLEVLIEKNNFMTYDEFYAELIDSQIYHMYYQYKKEYMTYIENDEQFYNNQVFVPKL